MKLALFNKPFHVLPQFTDSGGRRTLRDYVDLEGCYPAGRLDYDSEGLLVLTDFGPWQARISQPGSGFPKCYLAQVEGTASDAMLAPLRSGIDLADGRAQPAAVRVIDEPPGLWPRDPPVRFRKTVPTSWIELTLHEGRNRQVRRMTAAVGLPTLRLIRWSVGPWTLQGLRPGDFRIVDAQEADRVLSAARIARPRPLNPSVRRRRYASRARAPARS